MTLKQRKQTNNLPRYDFGKENISFNFNPQWITDNNLPNPVQNMTQTAQDRYNMLKDSFPVDDTLVGMKPFTGDPYHKSYEPVKPTSQKGGDIISNAIGFAGSTINAWGGVQKQNEILSNAGSSSNSIGGFGYQELNDINSQDEYAKLNTTGNTLSSASSGAALGASIGSIIPGVGTVVGGAVGGIVGAVSGIFGGLSRKDRLKKQIELANQSKDRQNTANRAGALSQSLQNDFYNQYGNTTDDVLYANRGKDLKQPKFN